MDVEEDMGSHLTPIIVIFIGLVIVTGLLIPFLLDLTHDPSVAVGDSQTYSPTSNFDSYNVEYSYGGTLLDHSEYVINEDGSITISFTEKGKFTFEVSAQSHHPFQSVTQVYDVEVGEYSGYSEYKPLLMVIPVLLLVGLILYALGRRIGGDGGGGLDGLALSGGGIIDVSGGFRRHGSR